MKSFFLASALVAAAFGAHAADLSNGQSAALTGTNTAVVSPGNIGNPNITFQGAQAPSAVTAAHTTIDGQPVASAAPVYVNSPGPAVCANAGIGGSLQGGGLGGALSIGGSSNDECDAREGAKTASFVGLPGVAKEMLCAVKQYREAFKRAGMMCSADNVKVATTTKGAQDSGMATPSGEPSDPFIRQRLGLPPQ
jgi:hypothetical protein